MTFNPDSILYSRKSLNPPAVQEIKMTSNLELASLKRDV